MRSSFQQFLGLCFLIIAIGGSIIVNGNQSNIDPETIILGWKGLRSKCDGPYSADVVKSSKGFRVINGKRMTFESETKYAVKTDGKSKLLDTELVSSHDKRKVGLRTVVCENPNGSFALSRIRETPAFHIDGENYDRGKLPDDEELIGIRREFLYPSGMDVATILGGKDFEITKISQSAEDSNHWLMAFRHLEPKKLKSTEMSLLAGELVVSKSLDWAIVRYSMAYSNKSVQSGTYKYDITSPVSLLEMNDTLTDESGMESFGETVKLVYSNVSFASPPAKDFTIEHYGVTSGKKKSFGRSWAVLTISFGLIVVGYILIRYRRP